MIDTRKPYRPGVITNWETIEKQVIYYRTHMDMFIEDAFAPIKLTPVQHVIAREVGNAMVSAVVAPRGYGKTWLIANIALSLGSLYPGTKILVVASAEIVFQVLKCQDRHLFGILLGQALRRHRVMHIRSGEALGVVLFPAGRQQKDSHT